MKANGWPAQSITMGQSMTEPGPGGYTLDLPSVDGYGWSGTQEKQLILKDSHLDVQVVFDTAHEHADYGHYEIIPGRDDPRSGDAH